MTGTWTETKTSWYKNPTTGVVYSEVTTEDKIASQSSGPTLSTNAANNSGEARQAKMTSVGTVKIRKRWVGLSVAPIKVWIQKKCSADATVMPNGTGSASNGMGAPAAYLEEYPYKSWSSTGTKVEEVSLSGNVLEVEFSLNYDATGQGSGPTYYNTASGSAGPSFVFKAGRPVSAGWRKEGNSRVSNRPVESRIDRVIQTEFADPGNPSSMVTYRAWGRVDRELIGSWLDPFNTWDGPDGAKNDTLFAEFEYYIISQVLSKSEADSMVNGTPKVYQVSYKVQDVIDGNFEAGGKPGGDINVHFHAPRENPHEYKGRFFYLNYKTIASGNVNPPLEVNGWADIPVDYRKAISTFLGVVANGMQGGGAMAANPYVEAIGSGIGVLATWCDMFSESIHITFEGAFIDPDSTFVGGNPAIIPASQWEMFQARKIGKDCIHYGQASKYDEGGYVGEVQDESIVLYDRKNVGTFRLIDPPSGGGGGVGGVGA